MTLPFLTDEEIKGICEPLIAPTAQCRYLRRLGLLVNEKPNGKPLVARSEFERVLGAARFGLSDPAAQPVGPDREAMLEYLGSRKPRARRS